MLAKFVSAFVLTVASVSAYAQTPTPFAMFRGQGAAAFTQATSVWGPIVGPGSMTIVYPQAVTSGNLLVACVGDDGNGQVISVSDDKANTWIQFAVWGSGSSGAFHCYYAANVAGGSVSFKASTNTDDFLVVSIYEISGVVPNLPLDQATTATGAFNSLTVTLSTPAAVSQSNEYVFVYAQDWNQYQTWTPSTGYTDKYSSDMSALKYIATAIEGDQRIGLSGVQSTTVNRSGISSTPAWTWGAAMATFKLR